jgi:hypothetical protein
MKKRTLGGYGIPLFVLSVGLACGKSAERQLEETSKKVEEAGKKMEEAARQGGEGMADAMKQMGEALTAGKKIDPVDFRELKSLLPETLPATKRTKAQGERAAALGINVSKAEASYQSDQGGSIDITITDMGNMSGITAMAACWALVDIDRESDSGYEKTGRYKGHKMHEKYDIPDRRGEIDVLVANRFIVEIDGNDMKMDALKGALDQIDVSKLDSMKAKGMK